MPNVGQRTLTNPYEGMYDDLISPFFSNIGRSPTDYTQQKEFGRQQSDIDTEMRIQAEAIERMNAARTARREQDIPRELGSFKPQGVVRPNLIPANYESGARAYGSYPQPVQTPVQAPVQAPVVSNELTNIDAANWKKGGSGQATTRRLGSDIPQNTMAENRSRFAAANPNYNPDRSWETQRSTPESIMTNRALGMGGANTQANIRKDNMRRAMEGKINLNVPAQELQRLGLGSLVPEQKTQSQTWHQSMKGKRLPRRDMRGDTYTSNVTGREVPNYTKQQRDSLSQAYRANLIDQQPNTPQQGLGTNQTADNQIPNNGNVNNPKLLNKPNANGSSNGFF